MQSNDGYLSWFVGAQDMTDNLEDASNELILADDPEVRYLIGEVFTHLPVDEVLIFPRKFSQTDDLRNFLKFLSMLSSFSSSKHFLDLNMDLFHL